MIPKTLDEAIAAIPPAWEVAFRRKAGDGGCYFHITRPLNGGEMRLMGGTLPTWQEAFADIWRNI